MNADYQYINDQSEERRFFHMMLNMADDDLNPYEYRLLGHYKRVCGENNGECTESIRKTAERCNMSTGMVSKARQSLESKGWMKLEYETEVRPDGKILILGCHVTLVDRWVENVNRYAKESTQGGVHVVNGCSLDEQGCSCGETKKNKEQEEPTRFSSGDEKTQDFAPGSVVFYVWERKNKPAVILEGVVIEHTAKRTKVNFGNQGIKSVAAHNLKREQPKLIRQTDATLDVVAEFGYGIPADALIGGATMSNLNMVKSELMTRYGDTYPSADETRAAYVLSAMKRPEITTPSRPVGVANLIKWFRDQPAHIRASAQPKPAVPPALPLTDAERVASVESMFGVIPGLGARAG